MLGSINGVEHNGKVTAGWIFHSGCNIKTADGKTVLLVFNRTCTDRNVGEQVFYISPVFRIKHFVCTGENWGYVEDLLSYVAIGARSVEDQQHRLTVSGFDVASGMKNPTSGDFSVMLNSVYAAQHPHHFVYRGYEVETSGNPLTHVVLRGAVSKHGNTTTNYHYEDLIRLHEMYDKMDVVNQAAIIDTNHSNSGKKFKEQIRIAKEVMHNRQLSSDIKSLVKGLMIESYIEEGSQKIGEHVYGKSITDPCLGWEDSKKLIYDIAEMNS